MTAAGLPVPPGVLRHHRRLRAVRRLGPRTGGVNRRDDWAGRGRCRRRHHRSGDHGVAGRDRRRSGSPRRSPTRSGPRMRVWAPRGTSPCARRAPRRTWRRRRLPGCTTPISTSAASTPCSMRSGAAGPRCGRRGRPRTGRAKGFDQSAAQIAVVVQKMVASEVAGVMFTANPLTAATDEIVDQRDLGTRRGARLRHRHAGRAHPRA